MGIKAGSLDCKYILNSGKGRYQQRLFAWDIQSIVLEIKENIQDFWKHLHIVIFLHRYYGKNNLHILIMPLT